MVAIRSVHSPLHVRGGRDREERGYAPPVSSAKAPRHGRKRVSRSRIHDPAKHQRQHQANPAHERNLNTPLDSERTGASDA